MYWIPIVNVHFPPTFWVGQCQTKGMSLVTLVAFHFIHVLKFMRRQIGYESYMMALAVVLLWIPFLVLYWQYWFTICTPLKVIDLFNALASHLWLLKVEYSNSMHFWLWNNLQNGDVEEGPFAQTCNGTCSRKRVCASTEPGDIWPASFIRWYSHLEYLSHCSDHLGIA